MAWLVPSRSTVKQLMADGMLKQNIYISWRDENGRIRKVSTGTKNYNEAKKKLAEFMIQEKEQRNGFTQTRLDDVFTEYVEGLSLRERSKKRYFAIAHNILEYFGCETMCHELTAEKIEDFKRWSMENIDVTTRDGVVKTKPRNADKTMNLELNFLKSCLKYAVNKGYLAIPIHEQIKTIPKTKVIQKQIRAFSEDELVKIFHSPGLDQNTVICFMGLLHLGVRLGELASITWSQVDLKAPSIRVYGEKTNKWRTIPVSNTLMPYIELAKKESGGCNNVFRLKSGKPVDKHLYRILMNICKQVGIETTGLTLHSFRHTFIQRHLQAGVNFKTIMSWSGHQDIKTFMVYLEQYNPNPEDINRADYTFLDSAIIETADQDNKGSLYETTHEDEDCSVGQRAIF